MKYEDQYKEEQYLKLLEKNKEIEEEINNRIFNYKQVKNYVDKIKYNQKEYEYGYRISDYRRSEYVLNMNEIEKMYEQVYPGGGSLQYVIDKNIILDKPNDCKNLKVIFIKEIMLL